MITSGPMTDLTNELVGKKLAILLSSIQFIEVTQ
jgi:hypothetical protein